MNLKYVKLTLKNVISLVHIAHVYFHNLKSS
jgi:hypothetical protein